MIYLGKIGGPKISEILKRKRNDFQQRTIHYYVWNQGRFIGNKTGGEDLLKGYDSAIKKAEKTEDEVSPIIYIGDVTYFEISFLAEGFQSFKILIAYGPTEEEMKLLGDDYRREIREIPELKIPPVRDDAWG